MIGSIFMLFRKAAALLALLAPAAPAAVPLRWTAETSRVQPARLEAVRGETLELEAAFTSYGRPLAMDGAPCAVYWQTNGMGSAYWVQAATASGSVVRATFAPEMDPGAGSVRGFLGQAGENYRAAFAIRFLDGPGAAPNALPLPTKRIDFAAVEAVNAPWISEESDPTVPAWAKAASKPAYTAYEVGAYAKAEIDAKGYVTKAVTNGLASAETVDALAAEVAGKANAASVYTKTQADARYYPADEGALWSSWWSGDGFRVVVSNYDVSAAAEGTVWERLPAAAFEYRPGGTGELVRVWDERTRWERARASFGEFTNALELVLADKAGLDWGRTTPTGFDAPPGFTWLDTPAVAVAGGLAWQKTVTSEGAIWLLCSNGMVAEFGSDAASTNGYFRITDERGETAFEIVQGDRRTVGANPGETYTWTAADNKTHLRVVYNVVSDAAPTLHVATELKPGGATAWKDEGADDCPASFAGWTGSSGAWTNALWRTSALAAGEKDALFCYATYESGGETVVKNHAPVALSKLVLGGVTYTVGTAEIGGHTVLTLTPQGGN